MAKYDLLEGPLDTPIGPQGGLGGEDPDNQGPKSSPDPLKLIQAGGKKKK